MKKILSLVFLTFVIPIISIFIGIYIALHFLNFTNIPDFENYKIWTSAFITTSSLLVAVLLASNFVQYLRVWDIVKKAEEKMDKIPQLEIESKKIENEFNQIKKKRNDTFIEENLKALNSTDEDDRNKAILNLGERGDDTCIIPLEKILKMQSESKRNEKAAIQSIARIKERSKLFYNY